MHNEKHTTVHQHHKTETRDKDKILEQLAVGVLQTV